MFLPRNAWGSFFSTSFTALVIFCLFDNSRSNKSESIPHYGFHLRFPDDQWCGVYFYIPNGHLYVFLEKKNAYSSPPALLLNSEPQSFILGFSATSLWLWSFKYFAKANSVTSRFLSALAYNGIIVQPPSEAWRQGICGAICGASFLEAIYSHPRLS